jgi:CBS domain-containing protein
LAEDFDDIQRVEQSVLSIKQGSEAPWLNERLRQIAQRVDAGKAVEPVTVREFLCWFEEGRRSVFATYWIRRSLIHYNLRTEPEFNRVPLDHAIRFLLGYKREEFDTRFLNHLYMEVFTDRLVGWTDENPGFSEDELRAKAEELNNLDLTDLVDGESAQIIAFPASVSSRAMTAPLHEDVPSQADREQTFVTEGSYTVGRIPSANIPPPVLDPSKTVADAIEILVRTKSSRVLVMGGQKRPDAKCVVSWAWIAMCLARGDSAKRLRVGQCSEKPQILDADTPLHEATDQIRRHGYVAVRDATKKISGIVTESDLVEQLHPFLLIDEIENRIRELIRSAGFSEQELLEARDFRDTRRSVRAASDLTFGEYVLLLEQPESWSKLRSFVPRKQFIQGLKRIKDIRDRVAHFRSHGEGDLNELREFAGYLHRLRPAMGPH